jgi:hypothetical protein
MTSDLLQSLVVVIASIAGMMFAARLAQRAARASRMKGPERPCPAHAPDEFLTH